jgi:ribosome-associated protein
MAKRVPRSARSRADRPARAPRVAKIIPDSTRPRPKPTRPTDAARRFAVDSARLMAEHHCEEVIILDLVGVSPICDYFVIATGTSDRQLRAVADHLVEMGKARGEAPFGVAGYDEGAWIIVDFVDVVVHLFDAERRSYYDLDSLWGDRPKVDWA